VAIREKACYNRGIATIDESLIETLISCIPSKDWEYSSLKEVPLD
jgi:hypothetical protein